MTRWSVSTTLDTEVREGLDGSRWWVSVIRKDGHKVARIDYLGKKRDAEASAAKEMRRMAREELATA